MSYEQWEVVFKTSDQVEASLIRGLLESNGFPVLVEAHGMKDMAAIFGHAAVGALWLKVPPDRADEARALLAADAELPEDEGEPRK